MKTVNIALPKGRLGEKVLNMLDQAGFSCPETKENDRRLIFESEQAGIRYFWVKPSDVAIYVERGAADIGIAGKDILLEYKPDVYELLDLNIGVCRMAVAAKRVFATTQTEPFAWQQNFPTLQGNFMRKRAATLTLSNSTAPLNWRRF